jgi:hypothetical protein
VGGTDGQLDPVNSDRERAAYLAGALQLVRKELDRDPCSVPPLSAKGLRSDLYKVQELSVV